MTKKRTKMNEIMAMLVAALACLLPACQDSRIAARRELTEELARRETQKDESLCRYQLAVKAYEQGDLKSARNHLNDAVKSYDRNAQAWMLLGLIEHREDKVFEAASCFHKASMLMPDRYEPIYNIGIILESFGRYKQAIEAYQAALKLSPNQLEVMENLVRCYMRTNGNLEEAKELIDRSLLSEQRPQWRQWLTDCSRKLESRRSEDK